MIRTSNIETKKKTKRRERSEKGFRQVIMSREIDEVKKVLKSLLITVPNGMCVSQLENEYREMEGRNIPRGGFGSIVGFLDSIPETVRVSIRYVKTENNYASI